MKIRHHDMEIPKENPFLNCKLDREQYAEVLTSIVKSYAEGFVLAVDNKWGTGKTTFVKMWRQQLTNEKFKTLYFNAWENDFQEEVMIALLAELSELRNKSEAKFKNVVAKGASFLKKVAPTVTRGLISKAIGDDAVAKIVEVATEFTSEKLESEIKKFTESKKGILDFRKSLERFVSTIGDDKPIIFIIDELDRCRPSYAVEVLEQIKHLFSVPGIVFVLSIDKIQLGNAIRGFYGSDRIDADEYLRRFIDLEYTIPEPSYQKFMTYLYSYFDFDSFLNSEERKKHFGLRDDDHEFIKFGCELFYYTKFSLRQIEKIMSQIRICLLSFKPNQYFIPRIFLFLVYLKDYKYQSYEQLKLKKLTLQELVDLYEELIEKIMGNNVAKERLNSFIQLEVMLASSYQKSFIYGEDVKLTEYIEGTNEKKLLVSSKLDQRENNEQFLHYLELLNRHYLSGIPNLTHFFTKIELLDPLIV